MGQVDKIRQLVERRKKELGGEVKRESGKLTLREIVDLVEESGLVSRFAYNNYKFNYGEPIDFSQRPLDFVLTPDNLCAYYESSMLKEFKGSRVRGVYNRLASEIQRKINDDLDDLPF